jgi:TolA-binding protein
METISKSSEMQHQPQGNKSSIYINPSVRKLVLLLAVCGSGCDGKQSVPPQLSAPSSSTATQSSSEGADALARRLKRLEGEAEQIDQGSVKEIQQLRQELNSKVDRTLVDAAVRTAMHSESDRIKGLQDRADKVEGRLRELEEPLGIRPRIPEAPWYKEDPMKSK